MKCWMHLSRPLSLGQTCPTLHPTSIIFCVGWNVGHVWPKAELKKEEKNVLDEAKMCWMKVWSRSNFSSNNFSFIQHIFCHFSYWMRLTTFFIQQYVKMMSFYCNRMSYRISKIRISIRKQNKSCFVCQITVSVQRWRTKTRRATAQLILLMIQLILLKGKPSEII